MIDGNKLGDAGYIYLGTPYKQMDCQKFVERCMADCGFKMDLSGSNAWYRYIMEHGVILSPEECVKQFGCVPKGAILFIHAFDGKEPEKYRNDGKGNASHMGIVTNETAEQMMAEILATIEDAKKRKEFIEKVSHGNGAIHSSSSRECVCTSTFKGKTINGGWNKVGLPDFVAYDYGGKATPAPTPAPAPSPDPKPSPEPIPVTATVYADNGRPVNFRKRANLAGALIERIPCGETVDVLDNMGDWCKIRWMGKTGYMMTKFLLIPEKDEELYCVTIHDLPRALAEEIANTYGGSITKE